MEHIFFVVFLFIASAIFSKVEIEIEGSDGWASKLPTKRFSPEHFLSRYVFSGRPATLYHIYILLFILVMSHMPYLFVSPSLIIESRVLSFVILFWCIEDFLWFAMNPHFGIGKFKGENIWWHEKQWWGFAPRDYFIFIPLGIALYLLSYAV